MSKDLLLDIIEVLERHGLFNKTGRRNFKIKTEFSIMRSQGIKAKNAKAILCDKYFMSEKNIEKIIYGNTKG